MSLLICLFTSFLASASDVDRYVHLSIVPRTFQDILPRIGRDLRLPAPVSIAKTKFHATIDLYYVPGRRDLPAFVQARYNVRRENHQFVEIETDMRAVDYVPHRTYESTRRAVEAERLEYFRRKGQSADYAEPEFAKSVVIATALEGKLDSRKGWSAVLDRIHSTQLNVDKDLNVALTDDLFSRPLEPSSVQPVQFRILHEERNYANRPQTIQYRRRFEGEARVVPLTAETRELLERLLLMSFECGRDGLPPAN